MKLEHLIRIAFCDPAGGKTNRQALKRTSARSAIVCIGIDDHLRIFVLHEWAARCPTDTLVDKIYELNDKFTPKIFGIESNAMQSLFGDMISREARRLKKRVPLSGVPQNTKVDKNWRIRTTIQPVLAEGRLFMQENQYELKAEIASFPMSPVVDLVDALASAIALAPRRPVQQQRHDEIESYAAYLRASGASPRYIEEQIASMRIHQPLSA